MNLTDRRKIKVYTLALKILPYKLGLCAAIEALKRLKLYDGVTTSNTFNDPYFTMKEIYPELFKYRPPYKGDGDYWFGGINTIGSVGYEKDHKFLLMKLIF